jgi:hypothetical protein
MFYIQTFDKEKPLAFFEPESNFNFSDFSRGMKRQHYPE